MIKKKRGVYLIWDLFLNLSRIIGMLLDKRKKTEIYYITEKYYIIQNKL